MKVLFILYICIGFLQQIYSQGSSDQPAPQSALTVECIGLTELLTATTIACNKKDDKVLWKKIIDCHRPMTDGVFFGF